MTENSEQPDVTFHLDSPAHWDNCPRLLTARGWMFANSGGPIKGVRAIVAGNIVEATTGHHRPDVREAFPQAPDDHCGFQISARTPTAEFPFEIQCQRADSGWKTVYAITAKAPRWRRPFFLGGGSAIELLEGQLTLTPQHSPRPIRPDPLLPTELNPKGSSITVVTPSYNQAEWLRQNLQSVNPSASDRVHHIVMDGQSTDESAQILREHDSSLAYWISEPDDGQADAIAKGFEHQAGENSEIMAWLNADDHYLPATLPFVQNYFDRHPHVDVIYGNRILVNEADEAIGSWVLPRHDPDVLRMYDFVPQETLFWRRACWDKIGGIDRKFQFAMDWDLLLRFAESGANIVHIPRRLGAFRIHSRQKSSAAIGHTGQFEIDSLRTRTFGREVGAAEIIDSPELQRYLRQSARATLLDRWGIRRPVR